MLINPIKIAKPLSLYFFSLKDTITGFETMDFGLQYTSDDLYKELQVKSGQEKIEVSILGEVEIQKIIDLIEDQKMMISLPRRLKKKEFLNNLNYTKDVFVKNEEHKLFLNHLLETLG